MNKKIIGVVGLGYVGLPLSLAFSKKYKTFGYDIDDNRVKQLNCGVDITEEVDLNELKNQISNNLEITSNLQKISHCTIYIITVPHQLQNLKPPT